MNDPETAPPPSGQLHKPQSAPVLLAMAVVALALAWAWMRFSQPLVDTIQVSSVFALASLYYALVYVPIAIIALAGANLAHMPAWRAGGGAAVALLAGAAGVALAAAMAWANNGIVVAPRAVGEGAGFLMLGLVLTLLQVGVEELFYRGWLLRLLDRVPGARGAVVLSALAYALITMSGGTFALLPFVNLVLFGLFLGLLAQRSGGIAAPVAAHFGWNAMEDFVLGLNPNPGAGLFGSAWNLDLLGGPLWGGTEAGLAASLGTSAVLVAFCLPLLAPRSRAAVSGTLQAGPA